MKNHHMSLVVLVTFSINGSLIAEERLNLDEATDRYDYLGGYQHNEKLQGYGTGGYGDPFTADVSLHVCQEGQQDGDNCSASDPDLGISEWRFIRNIGWRKFSRYGAARKDWWDFKKLLGWPFGRYQTFGYNWW